MESGVQVPRILCISRHIWNFCPVQIKDNCIITTKSAYRAHMLMCVFNGGGLAQILLALGGCTSFSGVAGLVMITTDIYHIY